MEQIQVIGPKKDRPKMRWIRVPRTFPPEKDPELEEFMEGVRDEIRALVGKHYYFIRVREEGAMLCRVPLFSTGKYFHEILEHGQHGISDDDLDHAVRMKGGDLSLDGYYKISDHIEGKLRALLDA